jgi:hypothetical protein
MPLDEAGFRGAVLLKRGKYTVSGTIHIRHSGVVVRGEGAGFAGTWIYHRPAEIADRTPSQYIHYPQPRKGMIPTFLTHGGKVATRKIADIKDDLIPAGEGRLHLDTVEEIAVGDEVVVICRHTQKWVDDLGLTESWEPEQLTLRFPRVVEQVERSTNEIVLNVPVTSRIDRANGYATGEIHVVTDDRRLRHVGLEDILFLSAYDRSIRGEGGYFTDEHHSNYVFRFYGVRDGWMRRCVAFFYSCGIVSTGGSQHLTIEDCAMLDGVSTDTPVHHTGSRKYYFNAQSEMLLFQRCYARYARHAFIGNGPCGGTSSSTAIPRRIICRASGISAGATGICSTTSTRKRPVRRSGLMTAIRFPTDSEPHSHCGGIALSTIAANGKRTSASTRNRRFVRTT